MALFLDPTATVIINETDIIPAQPSDQQKKACLVSCGATALPVGTLKWFGNLEDALGCLPAVGQNVLLRQDALSPPAAAEKTKDASRVLVEQDAPPSAAYIDLYNKINTFFAGSAPYGAFILELGPTAAETQWSSKGVALQAKTDYPEGATGLVYAIPAGAVPENASPAVSVSNFVGAGVENAVATVSPDGTAVNVSCDPLAAPLNKGSAATADFGGNNNGASASALLLPWLEQNPVAPYVYVLPSGDCAKEHFTDLAELVSAVSGYGSMRYIVLGGDTSGFEALANATPSAPALPKALQSDNLTILNDQAPGPLATSDIAAAFAQEFTNADPSVAYPLAAMNNRGLYGVNPWPLQDAAGSNVERLALFNQLNIGYAVASSAMAAYPSVLRWGHQSNGLSSVSRYGVDFTRLALQSGIKTFLETRSQPGTDPLKLSPHGVNELGAQASRIVQACINAGALEGGSAETIPFAQAYPPGNADYAKGIYRGLSVYCTPAGQIEQVIMTMTVDYTNGTVSVGGAS